MTWWSYALLSAFFAAATAILAKIGIKGIQPDLATAIRTVFILVLTWGIVLFRQELSGYKQLTASNLTFLALSGLATGLSWIFYFKALQIGKVSMVAPLDKISVVIAVLLSALFLNEPLTLKVLAGSLLITAGSLILIL